MPRSYASAMRRVLGAALLGSASISAMSLNLSQSYEGPTFFDDWTYNASVIDNTTQGNIHYLSREAATVSNLTYINSAGNAIIKVDNVTSGVGNPIFGRDSIKLVSNASFSLGTLYIIDAVHLPYGCSVWPAIWTLSSVYKTDDGGEVDIWEGINNVTSAQYTLHTADGCTQSNNTAFPYSEQSTVISTNCYYRVNGNQGCAFAGNNELTYGAPFAQNGGGVFATLWDGDGIRTWFWPRADIPADITSGSPDPDTWSAPIASWPSTTCDMEEFFTEQNIIINITLCGLWAGAADVFAQTCSGLCTDLIGEPSNYDTAYFELRSIKAYTGAPTTRSITAATQVNTTATSGTGSNANGNAGSGTGAGSKSVAASAGGVLVAGAVAAFVL